eukprot:TRINITY_DN1296_c0_g1_i1.p2 TRINITY_DN1296_c0_g1~~TRINITY_DN1296_c0_g1_i1.p2  ORF type:complete len:379 (-),score=125.73 TRINITY_DN1296_c0_g1_i1:1913-2998(-)
MAHKALARSSRVLAHVLAAGSAASTALFLSSSSCLAHNEKKVPTRALGSQGLKVPVIGLGCMGMSAFYISKEEADAKIEEHVKVIHEAESLGINFLDTAEVYGPHTNEVLVGKAVAGNRDKYIIATKFGIYPNPSAPGGRSFDSSPQRVRAACEGSLKRLGVDYIDLYYQHRPDANTPIEETMGELKKLVEEGKIKYIGLSETSAENIRKAHAIHPISALQYEWSIWSRELEKEVVPVAKELGIGIVAYSPLGRGFLAGRMKKLDDLDEKDWRRNNPRFKEFDANAQIAERVQAIAEKKGVTAAQVCLAWVLAQGDNVVTIPGTTSAKRLHENATAATIVLTPQELKELDVPQSQVKGNRY